MPRILNVAVVALVLLHTTDASMNPLLTSRNAMLTTFRRVPTTTSSTSVNFQSSSADTCIDEWYDNGCDELLEASNTFERKSSSATSCMDGLDLGDDKEVAMCSVSYKPKLKYEHAKKGKICIYNIMKNLF